MNDRKRIVICLDGTWQNPYQVKQRDDGTSVLKPSNVLKLARAVLPLDPSDLRPQITYYDVGIGALVKYPGRPNALLSFADRVLGGGWGAGFESNVEEAFRFLAHNLREGDQIFIFGFSRGAAQARALTHFLDWLGGVPAKTDAYFGPLFFLHYVRTRGAGRPDEVTTADGRRPDQPLVPVTIEFLGVWDTVMALGSRFHATTKTSTAGRVFFVSDTPAACVRKARQALAIDEQRYDFRPEVWRAAGRHQTLEQRWFAGSHSNIGGGYVHDGLANIPFRWLLKEAETSGLAVDRDFVKPYNPYPQAQLYRSTGPVYQALEFVRLRSGKGKRRLVGYPETSATILDRSVIHRIRSEPNDHPQLENYRPDNVVELLAAQDDLDGYLAGLGLNPEESRLPNDVVAVIRAIRRKHGMTL
jgi:uncharacterized protein (DUF2235 family)